MGDSMFLFAVPRFVTGMAATLDMGGTLTRYNESRTSDEADYRALREDWKVVGCDLRDAMNRYGELNGKNKKAAKRR